MWIMHLCSLPFQAPSSLARQSFSLALSSREIALHFYTSTLSTPTPPFHAAGRNYVCMFIIIYPKIS